MSEEIEKGFEHFLYLPPEIRMMMIEKMEPEDKCRLTRCSMACNKEAKNSKNYVHSLVILDECDNSIRIDIRHSKEEKGYSLSFVKNDSGGNDNVIYYDANFRELWRKKFDDSQSAFVLAAEKFKKLLEIHQNKIRCLVAIGDRQREFDFEIKQLKNLEKLSLTDGIGFSKIVPKLRRPLNHLCIYGRAIDVSDFQEIYQVKDSLELRDTNMTYEQMIRLSAPEVVLSIGDSTEIDIYNFIKSWKNGTLGKEVKKYTWIRYDESIFDISKLFRLFGASFDETQGTIDLYNKNGICAKLSYIDQFFSPKLTFEVKIDQQLHQ